MQRIRTVAGTSILATLLSAITTISTVSAQNFVVHDRFQEAQERVQNSLAFVDDEPYKDIQGENEAVAVTQVFPIPKNSGNTGFVSTHAPAFHQPGSPTPLSADITDYASPPGIEPVFIPVGNGPTRVFLDDYQQTPPDDFVRYGMTRVGRNVWTNAYQYEGMKGPGSGNSFGFSSAYCRSAYSTATDALGNRNDCDEWRHACGCDCCDEPFGLDIFKRRPYGPVVQKLIPGCRTQCNGCGEAGNCGTGGCQSCRHR